MIQIMSVTIHRIFIAMLKLSFLGFYLIVYQNQKLQAQFSAQQIDHVNKQIVFINESLHGMLVAHRIYEGYNQSVNKYIDLPSYNLSGFNNADLPMDIFEDKEKWFYPQSPNVLYREIMKEEIKTSMPPSMYKIIEDLNKTNTFINQDRNSIDDIIRTNQIDQLGGVQTVYKELETAIDYYEKAHTNVDQFEKDLMPFYHAIEMKEDRKSAYTALVELHYDVKAAIRHIRKNNQSGVLRVLPKVQKESNWLKVCIDNLSDERDRAPMLSAYQRIMEIEKSLRDYLENKNVPQEYAVLGKGYYYHNVVLLTKINRYGTGYVHLINDMMSKNGWNTLFLVEEPHYLKVIYPERIPLETLKNPNIDRELSVQQIINAPKPILSQKATSPTTSPVAIEPSLVPVVPSTGASKSTVNIPEEDLILYASPIRESPRVIKRSQSITADSSYVEIEIYDHLIIDGDRVSINVNGEWVFTNLCLEKQTKRIALTLELGKENFILIHADNTGGRPPNTVGVRYASKGKVQHFFLTTDLSTSELIEIKYEPRN